MTENDKLGLPSFDIEKLEKLMEEMANAPKEEYGVRQPGERCMYEIQRRENFEERTGKKLQA